MTESEAWDSLADHLKTGNRTGVLVLADWFQENGKEEVAAYLRWAEKNGQLPDWRTNKICSGWVIRSADRSEGDYLTDYHKLAVEVVRQSESLQELREWCSD